MGNTAINFFIFTERLAKLEILCQIPSSPTLNTGR